MPAMRLLAFVLVVGCSNKSGPSCAEQALDLDRFLMGLDREQSVQLSANTHLVTRDDLPAAKQSDGVAIELGPRDTMIAGQLVARDEIADTLAARHARAVDEQALGRRHPADPQLLYLSIDETVPWERVVASAEGAQQVGFTTLAFVFARTATVKRPPRSPVDDQLDKIETSDDPSTKATQLAKLIQGVIKPCPPLTEAFGRVASTDTDDKATYIIQQVQPALVDCECKVDIPSLRSALWRVIANTRPTTDVRIALDRAAPPIALPAATPWRDAQNQLKPGAATGWLVVRP